ncbi:MULTISPECIES: adaptor protein MecA [unclassified Ligilactobacillus]|uniref:adaptor protein MecA n=1 Tax=unclassified Ligilactobacillus TaxID=2767920 RepID=UPI0038548F87
MEVERVNERTIRVLLGMDDLEAHDVTVLDLLGNQKEVERFFYQILAEVDTNHEFQDNDAVTFQIMPNRHGLELFITKVDVDEDGKPKDEPLLGVPLAANDAAHKDSGDGDVRRTTVAADEEKSATSLTHEPHHLVYAFATFSAVQTLAQDIDASAVVSHLYALDDQYYLDVVVYDDVLGTTGLATLRGMLAEYGDRAVRLTGAMLRERGRLLLRDSALQLVRHYFPVD